MENSNPTGNIFEEKFLIIRACSVNGNICLLNQTEINASGQLCKPEHLQDAL